MAKSVYGSSVNARKSNSDLGFRVATRVLVKEDIMIALNVTTQPMMITVHLKPSLGIEKYAMMGKTIPPVEAPHVARDTATARFFLK